MIELIVYVWKFVRPYRLRILFFLFLGVLIAGISLLEPYIYKLLIDNLVAGDAGKFSGIMYLVLLWAFFNFISSLITLSFRYMSDRTFTRVMVDFYNYGFERIMNLDVKKHLAKRSGEIVQTFDRGGYNMFSLLFNLFIDVFPVTLTFVIVFCFAMFYNWKMGLITASFLPVYVLLFLIGGKKITVFQKKVVKNYEELYGQVIDVASNILVVKSFVREIKEKIFYSKMLEDVYNNEKHLSLWDSLMNSGQNFVQVLNKIVIFSFGVYFVLNNQITVGDLILFLTLSSFIYAPVNMFSFSLRQLSRSKEQILAAKKIIEDVVMVSDLPGAKELRSKNAEIEFNEVDFRYDKMKILFKGLSFKIPAQKITAMVGSSGSGKSTLVSLLNRFYDVDKGEIKINGRDIRTYKLASLRGNIGIVLQDNTMFNDTIFNNIKYGNLRASRVDVMNAAKKAQIHKFIMSLPEKYETVVGERGLKLSGGERQRVAIARAILKNPPILILDEATSALDSETEKLIQKALSEVMKGRTTIIIAHRLSTVRKADNILVFSKGRLVEQGSHEELMKAEGRYKKMVDMQVKGFFE